MESSDGRRRRISLRWVDRKRVVVVGVWIALTLFERSVRLGKHRGLGFSHGDEYSGRIGLDIHTSGVVLGIHTAAPGRCGEVARNDRGKRMVEDYLLCSRFEVRSLRILSRVAAKAGSRETLSAIREQA